MIGYSDVTAILLAVYARTGCPVYYGPALVPSFGEFPPFVNQTFDSFKQVLQVAYELPMQLTAPDEWTDDSANWEIKTREKEQHQNRWIGVNGGEASGRLIGGNLNAMNGFWGSPYMPELKKGDLLLIEDSMKDAAQVRSKKTSRCLK